MYKSGIVCVVIGFVLNSAKAITDEQKAQIQSKFLELGAECIKDHPLTEEDITDLRNKKFAGGENAGCFTACIFRKAGIFDDKGNLSQTGAVDNAKKVFEGEDELKNLEEFLTTCSKVNNEDVTDGDKGCDRAKLAFNCLNENSEKFGFNIDF